MVLAARDTVGLSRQVQAIQEAGRNALALPVDVTNEDSVKALLAEVQDRFGRPDAAVNNATGGGRPPAPLVEWTSADFDGAISVSLRGVFLCLKYEIELMLASGNGRATVNMSSTADEQGVAGLSGYVTSKFGVGGITRVAALDYAATVFGSTRSPRGPSSRTGSRRRAKRHRRRSPRRCHWAGSAPPRTLPPQPCGCAPNGPPLSRARS